MQNPSLYGIRNSNRDFSQPYYWGKNQFNSSFPVALACYMRDKKESAVFLTLSAKGKIRQGDISFDDVFNTNLNNVNLFFSFESRYEPFGKFLHDELKPIDLVIKDNAAGKFIRPVEIKLTTIPDNTTASLTEDKYGSEMVVRSPTMRYMALSMAESCQRHFKDMRNIFEPACRKIRAWDNAHEIKSRMDDIFKALEQFFVAYSKYERPLLMQPVWKTIGKSARLADNCLDIFVWSDFALSRLFMDSALESARAEITRQQRAALRLARFLYEVSKDRKVYQAPIYDGMTYDSQNDKEFAIPGTKMNPFMKSKRLIAPSINKNEIKKIILGGGQKYLSPERRFDAIIYFSTDLFGEEENDGNQGG